MIILLIQPQNLYAQFTFDKTIISTGISKNSGLFSADIDNDGNKDLIGNSYNQGGIFWWKNNGDDPIVWEKLVVDDDFAGAQYVYSEDIDGDGRLDIIATAAVNDAQVAWWHNDGGNPIRWTREIIRENFGNAHGIYSSDINGDGSSDILATASFDNLICWWENDGNYPVNWTEHVIDNNAPISQSVLSTDIDKDGDNDVIATSNNSVFLYSNEGGNPISWNKSIVDNNCKVAHWIDVADINNDSYEDIVACGYGESYLKWYENDGKDSISWKEHQISGRFFGSLTVIAADLNNDNRIDLVGTSHQRNELSWWRNDGGDPVSWTKQTISNFSYPWALVSDDIDKDGDNDIFVGSNTLGQIFFFENSLNLTSIKVSNYNKPNNFVLHQNYPNPFNPKTTIKYSLLRKQNVNLKVYDLHGKEIATLINENKSAGQYEVEFSPNDLTSGVYIYQLRGENFVQSKKLLFLK